MEMRGEGQGSPFDLAAIHRFGFLTLPNYSMIAFANAVEACRGANYVDPRAGYRWQVVTLDGKPARASNGLLIEPTLALEEAGPFDVVFACGGVDIRHAMSRRLGAALRRLAKNGIALGALCTGTYALAEAGVLAGYRSVIHWENIEAARTEFPNVDFVEDLFVIDRDRLTCSGGIAPLDMMLALIYARLGAEKAAAVSAEFILERIRSGAERQYEPLGPRAVRGHPVLERAVQAIEETLEAPMKVGALARRAGISVRQLERLFRRHLGTTPGGYASTVRLERARALLRLTATPVTEVGLACGFQSPSHFSAAYRQRFGHAPRSERDGAAGLRAS
jgi:AraC family transcriptional regulator, glycine betaine-responsive activator